MLNLLNVIDLVAVVVTVVDVDCFYMSLFPLSRRLTALACDST